jgi:hypothetical protein
MNAVANLKARHEVLDTLLHEMSCAVDRSTKREILQDLARELASETPDSWRDAESERLGRIERLLTDLRRMDVDEQSFDAGVTALQEEVDCELDDRETILLPRLAAALEAPALHA